MRKKLCLIIVVLATLLCSLLLNVTATPLTTMMHVDPPTKTVDLGDILTINITIMNVSDLYSWQFKLYYKKILTCTSVTEGEFLKRNGNSTFWPGATINNTYNSTHGRLDVGCSRTGMVPGESGSGVLATVTFKALSAGNTALHLFDTGLFDPPGVGANPISHRTSDGAVHVESVAGHDVAIIDVISSKTVVCQGYSVSFNVTAQNQGDYTETFNVTVHANVTEIATELVTLIEGNSTTIEFTWNSTDIALGTYVISAYAHPVPGETDTADNTYVDGTVKITKSPTASFTYTPPSPTADETVTFNASTSTPNGGTITSYKWDFGDLNTTSTPDPLITHVYTSEGTYNVTLTITDSEALTDTTWQQVQVTVTGIQLPGDANSDGIVNWEDLFILAASYGSYPGHDRWNPDCDFNDDDTVNWQDLFTLAAYYGKTC